MLWTFWQFTVSAGNKQWHLPDDAEVCRALEFSEQTFWKWRKEFGGLKLSQAWQPRQFEKEDEQFKRLVADLALANQALKEQADRGDWRMAPRLTLQVDQEVGTC